MRTHAPYEPLVSVLTPSFNQARWLADNLRSVACQTYQRIEHIVMDGGSNDGSRDLLEAAGPQVRWKSEPDRGQSHALNKALAESGGQVIGWVNSDDAYFDSRVVDDVVRFFARNPGVDVVYGHAAYVNADGRILHYFWAPPFHCWMLRLLDYIRQPTVFLRRRALGDHLVDESFEFAMDYELWLRLAQRHRFARFDRVIAIDRVQPERKSQTLLHVMRSDIERLAAAHGVVVSPAARPFKSAHDIYCRFRGARLAVTDHGELAFSGRQDRRSAVLRRQVASRRSTMPVSDR
jgi:glycosyltransferase involved in cell wall biosynthesis